jgi:ribosome modulation factor
MVSHGDDIHSRTKRAAELGRVAGKNPEAMASSCPYSHDEMPMRFAWLDGFSEGRISFAGDHKWLGTGMEDDRRGWVTSHHARV